MNWKSKLAEARAIFADEWSAIEAIEFEDSKGEMRLEKMPDNDRLPSWEARNALVHTFGGRGFDTGARAITVWTQRMVYRSVLLQDREPMLVGVPRHPRVAQALNTKGQER